MPICPFAVVADRPDPQVQPSLHIPFVEYECKHSAFIKVCICNSLVGGGCLPAANLTRSGPAPIFSASKWASCGPSLNNSV